MTSTRSKGSPRRKQKPGSVTAGRDQSQGSADKLRSIVLNYREVAEEFGRSPSRAEYLAHPLHKYSQKQIRNFFGTWIQLTRAAGSTPSKMANTAKVDLPVKEAPVVWLIDIETKPLLSFTWGIFDQNVGLNQIKEEWHLLSFAAKKLGSKDIVYFDQSKAKNLEDDTPLLKELWKILNEADVIVGHNAKSFDVKKVQARMILAGMKPPSPFKVLDTKILAKRHFAFTSNKLEWLSGKLCKTSKMTKRQFEGFSLWLGCMNGEKAAWDEMRAYNRVDVIALEELFLKLLPWGLGLDFNVYRTATGFLCNCGSSKFTKAKEFHYTPSGVFEKYSCDGKDCGAWVHAKGADRNLLSRAKKASLKGP